MNVDVKLLKAICEAPGAPGFENPVRELIIQKIKDHVDSYTIDNMGNVIALKKGVRNPDEKKVMVAAHMDEIGFLVSHIDDNGFIRFQTLGGFDPKTLTAQRVIIHGKEDVIGVMGSKPIHVMKPEERNKPPKIDEYFIDCGMSKEELEKVIEIGDPITRQRELIEMGQCVNCKSIDNRVSVYILIEALKQLKDPAYDVYGVFTVQEEVGIRGANVASHSLNPDYGIALDTTIAYDLPGAQSHERVTELGGGTAVKIMDAMTICDSRMVKFLKATANKHEIKWQPEILAAGGTDTSGVQRMGKNGSIAGAISIPTRHLHQVIEMAHKEDIVASTQLLVYALEELDTASWEY
ncbi:M42 family metallopeptidase [Marinoscillum furvescens]|uniref:Endoglucanase n=1 Tax=Marinoscillum furvescens DSM 4134 TaxID=1122208 RepID=A0A3D9LJZ5_MARFU|nr:M42 family metallopeptidase [Marinoscillum furvescens]REE05572.1 endoglucanase [Marinoscillum furvescens DSM 4134]